MIDETKVTMQLVLNYLHDGMSLDDALVLADCEVEFFNNYQKNNPAYAKLVVKKQVEYKHRVVKAINEALNKKDPKIAQWIAEAKYSSEYSKKRNKDGEGVRNPITNIINLIQSGRAGEIVLPKMTSGRAADTMAERLSSLNQ